MVLGLLAGYGLGAVHFFRFLVPMKRGRRKRELFVGTLAEIPVGASQTIRPPGSDEIALARVSDDAEDPAAGFKALSSKCPHLGCKVHWVPADEQFLCPCHNGVFDKHGAAVSGPPAKEGKDLVQFEVKVDPRNGWVFVMVPESPEHGA